MKYIIFGTGNYAKYFCKCLNLDDVLCFIDNDEKKRGCTFLERKIYKPEEIDLSNADYIIIMIMKYNGIIEQLHELGVDEGKIIAYVDMWKILAIPVKIKISGKEMPLLEWKSEKKSIFMVVQDLSYVGVPVAVMHMAELFMQMGYSVVIGCYGAGPLGNELNAKGISFIECIGAQKWNRDLEKFIKGFDAILIGTLGAVWFFDYYREIDTPVFLWINETHNNVFDTYRLPAHKDNYFYFVDGDKTKKIFDLNYPDRTANNLYYFLPDDELSNYNKSEIDNKITFTLVAAHRKRKGHDIFVKAISMIPDKLRRYMRFKIVGPENIKYTNEWKSEAESISEITLIGEVSQKELKEIFSETDVLVCPSREDTVPIVVTQAFQNFIPCIVSNQVGQSMYMNNGYGGFVFENENVKEFAKCMIFFAEHRDALKEKGTEAREIFKKYFSKEAVKKVVEEEIIPYI